MGGIVDVVPGNVDFYRVIARIYRLGLNIAHVILHGDYTNACYTVIHGYSCFLCRAVVDKLCRHSESEIVRCEVKLCNGDLAGRRAAFNIRRVCAVIHKRESLVACEFYRGNDSLSRGIVENFRAVNNGIVVNGNCKAALALCSCGGIRRKISRAVKLYKSRNVEFYFIAVLVFCVLVGGLDNKLGFVFYRGLVVCKYSQVGIVCNAVFLVDILPAPVCAKAHCCKSVAVRHLDGGKTCCAVVAICADVLIIVAVFHRAVI